MALTGPNDSPASQANMQEEDTIPVYTRWSSVCLELHSTYKAHLRQRDTLAFDFRACRYVTDFLQAWRKRTKIAVQKSTLD